MGDESMYLRWHGESVEIPNVSMARVLLEVPVISSEGKQHTVHLPFVVDLEDLAELTLILTQNGYHYSVQPVETEVD